MASNNAIVAAATHYSFESDGSIVLAGRLGSIRVRPDGATQPVVTTPGAYGYPACSDPAYLLEVQRAAADFLAKAAH